VEVCWRIARRRCLDGANGGPWSAQLSRDRNRAGSGHPYGDRIVCDHRAAAHDGLLSSQPGRGSRGADIVRTKKERGAPTISVSRRHSRQSPATERTPPCTPSTPSVHQTSQWSGWNLCILSRARRTRWAGDDPTESKGGEYFIASAELSRCPAKDVCVVDRAILRARTIYPCDRPPAQHIPTGRAGIGPTRCTTSIPNMHRSD
jgi:hypothetical protein